MISIITCKRPGSIRYIHTILAALDRENQIPVIFEDTSLRTPPDNKYIAWRVFEKAIETGEDLLFLEDDVAPALEGAIKFAVDYKVPENCAWSSLYHKDDQRIGIQPTIGFIRSQAVKIPARTLPLLVGFAKYNMFDLELVTGVDIAMAITGKYNGWQYEQSPISYFNHIGDVSAVLGY